jgi:uncharacterized membrane protein YfcA
MHILKTVIYSKLTDMTVHTLIIGAAMGAAMLAGTFAANRFIKKMDKNRFQIYVAVLLCAVGLYMTAIGAV